MLIHYNFLTEPNFENPNLLFKATLLIFFFFFLDINLIIL